MQGPTCLKPLSESLSRIDLRGVSTETMWSLKSSSAESKSQPCPHYCVHLRTGNQKYYRNNSSIASIFFCHPQGLSAPHTTMPILLAKQHLVRLAWSTPLYNQGRTFLLADEDASATFVEAIIIVETIAPRRKSPSRGGKWILRMQCSKDSSLFLYWQQLWRFPFPMLLPGPGRSPAQSSRVTARSCAV